ncbi:MAG: PAS domain-containing sensor histidine kinase [Anaerolineae bacterium]|nr:PAS domain-containing sensor histidine kinase [Anaerolineae bacterium]
MDLQSPAFTPYGSFWTGDVAETLAPFSTEHNAGTDTCPATGSMAVVPFLIDDRNCGILRLECAHRDAFTRDTIDSYEALVETIGFAIAERRAQAGLRERVKELTCLYDIARMVEDSRDNLDASLELIAAALPPAWQFPGIAVARVILDGTEHATAGFEAVRSRQVTDIVVNGVSRGKVEVGYVEEVAHAISDPFLPDEGHLLEAVAREVGELVARREAEAERWMLEQQLRHADRLATIGHLAAGIAHEINEPLGSILGFAQLAKKGSDVAESSANDLNKIIDSCLQVREIVNKLKLFARQAPIEKTWVSVADVVEEACSLVEGRCTNEGIDIVTHLEPQLSNVHADPVQLKQVVINLAVNAMQAMPDGGTLTVAAYSDRRTAVIEVQDTGTGIAEDVLSEIFSPFFTTKDVGEGTGLGLSVVHGIVTAHGGTVEVESEVGKGAKFTVRLPLSATPVAHVGQDTEP